MYKQYKWKFQKNRLHSALKENAFSELRMPTMGWYCPRWESLLESFEFTQTSSVNYVINKPILPTL